MEMDFGIASVAAITVICFFAGQIIKATKLDKKWLPCIVGAVGAALGLAGLWVIPNFPAQEPLTALAVGIVSGLASTGVHQLGKQLKEG